MNGITKRSMNIFKVCTLPLSAGVLVLIWTALYLAFTEVGEVVIKGVQGRYYIPLLLPLFWFFIQIRFIQNGKRRTTTWLCI